MNRPMIGTAVAGLALAILAGCGPSDEAGSTNAADAGRQTGGAPQGGDKPGPVPDGQRMCMVPEPEIEKAVADEVTTFIDTAERCLYSFAKLRMNVQIQTSDGSENEGIKVKEERELPDVSPEATLVVDEFDEQRITIPLTEGAIVIDLQLVSPDDDKGIQAGIKVATLYARKLSG